MTSAVAEKLEAKQEILLSDETKNLPIVTDSPDVKSLLAIIDRVAENPEIDLERVRELFAMRDSMVAEYREQAFNEAMALAQGEIGAVAVNCQNDFTKSTYANLDAIHREAKPIWTKYGFSVFTRDKPSTTSGFQHVSTEIRHAAGHKEVIEGDWPLDIGGKDGNKNKTPIQAIGSTRSYARRYNELAAFDIAITYEDNDGNPIKPQQSVSACSNAPISQGQITNLRKLIADNGYPEERLLKRARVDDIGQITQSRFAAVKNGVQQEINKMKQQAGQ